jgi:hypothetical protein
MRYLHLAGPTNMMVARPLALYAQAMLAMAMLAFSEDIREHSRR